MSVYTVFFRVGDKKLKKDVIADTEEQAKKKIIDSLRFDRVEMYVVKPEDKDFIDKLMSIFR